MNKKKKRKQQKQTKKKSGIVKKILYTVIVILIIAAIALAAVVGVKYFRSRGSGDFSLAHGEEKYTENGSLTLTSGDEIKVNAKERYSVVISAAETEEDFAFKVGIDRFKWSEVQSKSFTRAFTLKQTSDGFTVEFGTLSEIISAAYGGMDAVIDETADAEKILGMDLFTVTVFSGEDKISLHCKMNLALGTVGALDGSEPGIGGVETDKDHVIM